LSGSQWNPDSQVQEIFEVSSEKGAGTLKKKKKSNRETAGSLEEEGGESWADR